MGVEVVYLVDATLRGDEIADQPSVVVGGLSLGDVVREKNIAYWGLGYAAEV